ncbi:glutathione transferase [Aspergillus filifer]
MEPITVWMTPSGPNAWRVVIVIRGLPYKINSFKFEKVKKPPFININPMNKFQVGGCAIEDPNTQITLWESGAIIQYLIEQYDKDHKLSYGTLRERQFCNQWLHFQMSGQGPYYGQCACPPPRERTLAIERYTEEIHRILGVLNRVLEGKTWLVGDALGQYPNVLAWHTRMRTLDTWADCEAERARIMGEQGLDINGLPKGVNNMEEFQKLMAEGELK